MKRIFPLRCTNLAIMEFTIVRYLWRMPKEHEP